MCLAPNTGLRSSVGNDTQLYVGGTALNPEEA